MAKRATVAKALTRAAKGIGKVLGLLVVMTFIVLATGASLIWLGARTNRFEDLRPAVALPLLLLVGLGSLLLLITVIVAVLDGFGLTDKRHAFGLPDGSMQAIIALSLILIFIISSLYLYNSLPQQVAKVDKDLAQSRFELAQQLLTTVGTLAVAVAGFYFGTRSVESARLSVGPEPEADTLRLRWPTSPTTLDAARGTVLEPIIVDTDPDDRRIKAEIVSGDDDGTLEEVQPGQFRYTRGSSAAGRVVLAFSFTDGSEEQELEIRTKP
jgi:hypothetical protein